MNTLLLMKGLIDGAVFTETKYSAPFIQDINDHHNSLEPNVGKQNFVFKSTF